MKTYQLSAQKRTLTGRKVKQLRKQKLLPANVFGKKVQSLAVQMTEGDFAKVYKQAGETGLVELTVDGEKRPTLIKNVQIHPVSGVPLHADFYQVDLKEKIHARVPVEIVGTAEAVAQKLGVLLEITDEVEVECLPTVLPDKLSVDVGKLAQVGQAITVGDLSLPEGVVALTSKETELVKIGSLVTKEAEKLAAEEAAAKAAQVAETAAAPTEGAAPTAAAPAEAKTAPEAKAEK